jgi:hypothetical protein
LDLLASRGYNPSVPVLSERLLGGTVPADDLQDLLGGLDDVVEEEGFVYLEGKRFVERCKRRIAANGHAQPLYRRLAEAYVRDLVRLCPWVKCVMLVGSVATGGLRKGDDLDLNLVVEDGRKYTTNIIGSMLNRKYSLQYGRELGLKPTHHYLIPMVVCLNIIWEESQARPLERQDVQVAHEIYSANVLYGEAYFEGLLKDNEWLRGFFPQLYESGPRKAGTSPKTAANVNTRTGIIERVVRAGLFNFDRVVRVYLSKKHGTLASMDYYEDIKRPYGLYDVPGTENGHSWEPDEEVGDR